ncbi:calcium-binding protein [Streptomyces sp. enrichment culture]|uniref:calcium-binding protein n=1 Tax=Streptomyces sp. enrichment culture TaxID=1795815 RepID=UPI003F579827
MRTRVTLAAVSGALALSALALPAAQADEEPADITVTNVVANDGKPIVMNGTGYKRVTVTMTVTAAAGVEEADATLWTGGVMPPSPDDLDGLNWPDMAEARTPDGLLDCTEVNATTATCGATFVLRPQRWEGGGFDTFVTVTDKNGGTYQNVNVKSFTYKRHSIVRLDASPEPVRKGGTITVRGKLTTAGYPYSYGYVPVAAQNVTLQFKKAGTSTWATLKTVKSNRDGALRTTTTATYDGYYRFSYPGDHRNAPAVSVADHVDVR